MPARLASVQPTKSARSSVIEELSNSGVVVSVESYDLEVAAVRLKAGAGVVNLTGSDVDDEMFDLAAAHGASVILCSNCLALTLEPWMVATWSLIRCLDCSTDSGPHPTRT
ncbi:MAG: dihydropteroate synthase [Marmoricola sp.]